MGGCELPKVKRRARWAEKGAMKAVEKGFMGYLETVM